ncbi:MAG: SET domain-containing protein-lysine N-methyltransferase [Verrucomicrobiota bacterium]
MDTVLSIEFRTSPIHGTGGYAVAFIPEGTRVIEYLGDSIDKAESQKQCEADNPYVFALDEERDLNGDVPWNPARHINHSCAPNCEAQLHDGHIWVVACRDIQPGEEVTFNYGFDLANYRDYPCRCGAPECVGFMVAEEFFDAVRSRNTPE